MNKVFTDLAWEDYLYWEQADKKIFRRINQLIKDIDRSGSNRTGFKRCLHCRLINQSSPTKVKQDGRIFHHVEFALADASGGFWRDPHVKRNNVSLLKDRVAINHFGISV